MASKMQNDVNKNERAVQDEKFWQFQKEQDVKRLDKTRA